MYCKLCDGEIGNEAKKCKHCGEWVIEDKKKSGKKVFVIMAALFLIGIAGIAVANSAPDISSYLSSNVFNTDNDLKLQYSAKSKTYSYTDKSGKTVITLSPDITKAYDFSDGLAIVISNDKYGAIDKTGKYVINPVYDDLWTTTEGLTAYSTVKNEDEVYVGYLDKAGIVAIQPKMHKSDYCPGSFLYDPSFVEGLAVSYDEAAGKFGYIDKKGEFAIKPIFDDAEPFSDGLAAVNLNGKFGYIDTKGKVVIAPQFDYAEAFSEGLALVGINSGITDYQTTSYGYINNKGRFVINAKYEKAYDFSDGLAAVRLNNKWGYIDKTGTFKINTVYQGISFGYSSYERTTIDEDEDYAFKFINGVAPVCIKANNDESRYALVNKDGQIVGDKHFDWIDRVTSDTYAVVIGEAEGLIDSKGNWIEPIILPKKKVVKIEPQKVQPESVKKISKQTKKVTTKVKSSNAMNDLNNAEQDLLN